MIMYERSYIEVAVGVLKKRIDDIAYELRSNNLDESEYEALHLESGQLHRAVNELMELKWIGGTRIGI